MRLERATYEAIKYACVNYHYSRAVPVNPIGFAVFNDKKEFCGVITYGAGASRHLGTKYGLKNGEFLELTRVALNGKQECTSKAVAISLKLIRKLCPTVKMIISFADLDRNHKGIIYQATNWIYGGKCNEGQVTGRLVNGKRVHLRSYAKMAKQFPDAKKLATAGKHRYLFPFSADMVKLCEGLKVPYPKADKAVVV